MSSARSKSRKEEKTEEVMADWGFKDARVAQAMMKRAKRMGKGKKNQENKAKMKDPFYRFEKLRRASGGAGT